MILRRVIQHVRKQEWTAIWIDLVIVVVGVFIGIQVANWNAANADRKIADKYLADIAADIRTDINELAHTMDSAMVRIGASAYILREAGISGLAPDMELIQSGDTGAFSGFERIAIPDVEAPPAARRNRLWSLTTRTYMYDPNRSAYDALVSSGKIELIGDPRVMRALREYYYLVNALSASQMRTLSPMRQQIIEAGIAQGYSLSGVVDEATLIERVRSDRAFAATVATSRELASVHLLLCAALDKKAHELLPLLEGEKP